MLLGSEVGRDALLGAYEAPLNSDSRWIHIVEELNEDLGSDERHSDSVRGQEGPQAGS